VEEKRDIFRLLFDQAPDAIMLIDWPSKIFINCNKASEALFEKSKDELIGQQISSIFNTKDAEYYINLFNENIENFGSFNNEVRISVNSGGNKTLHVSAIKTFIDDIPIVQSIYRDISKKAVESEERLLKTKFEGILEMAGGVLNEMIQPLQVIYGYSEALSKDIDNEDPNFKRVMSIIQQVDKLKNLMAMIQNISKYETKMYFGKKIMDIEKSSKGALVGN